MFELPPRRRRTGPGLACAIAAHAALFFALTHVHRARPVGGGPTDSSTPEQLTWVRGGGGGGGGAPSETHATPLRRRGHDRATMPSAPSTPTTPLPSNAPERDPIDRVVVPVAPLGDALTSVMGLIQPTVSAEGLRGPGRGGNGAGGGDGDGDGPGKGPGLGPGSLGGTGDGPYRDGDLGVSHPIIVTMVQPRYTNEAMRARVQGTVVVECVVRVTGVCSDIRVVRSLDRSFGLDEEAKRTAALWRFKPGTRLGQPVPVLVRIELQFNVR